MDVPEDLRYSTDHEWVKRDGASLRIGITDYARDALGDVVYVSLPEIGSEVTAGTPAGEVESTKAISEIYVPISGTITQVNVALNDDPDPINRSPYGDGWLFCIQPDDPSAIDGLLDASAYRALTED